MVCMYCAAPTQVTNSRQQRRTNDIWRRRSCTQCGNIFTSLERAELSSAIRLARTPNTFEPFSRDILFISLYEACKHRPTAMRDASNITQQVIAKALRAQSTPGIITREQLTNACLEILKSFDAAAATFYAAYHPHRPA